MYDADLPSTPAPSTSPTINPNIHPTHLSGWRLRLIKIWRLYDTFFRMTFALLQKEIAYNIQQGVCVLRDWLTQKQTQKEVVYGVAVVNPACISCCLLVFHKDCENVYLCKWCDREGIKLRYTRMPSIQDPSALTLPPRREHK